MQLSRNFKLAIVDPYIQEPVPHCYNRISQLVQVPITIHHPAFHGVTSLQTVQSDAIIVLGSASHVSQKLPWHRPLAEVLNDRLEKNIPVLGLCFGHQLMADYYGASVDYYKTPQDRLYGSRKIILTKDFDQLKTGTELYLAVTHRQIVKSLPDSMESLGHGQTPYLEFDFIRHKSLPFVGSQPHAEASSYFCINNAEVENEKFSAVQNDGAKLILNFFSNFFS